MAVEGQENLQEESRSQERIRELSTKVESTAKERDELQTGKEAAEKSAAESAKERDFYMQFSDIVATNPQAKEHKDAILEKVKAGYSAEDAAISVLAKAGQYTPPSVERTPIAGGSADIAITTESGQKQIHEMSREEKRTALMAAEQRGDISLT